MTIAIYSLLHMLVDGICAFAMISRFTIGEYGYWNILIYNFCAFALQMPFGLLLDILIKNSKCKASQRLLYFYVILGCILTIIGAFSMPALLGLGNALFHVGGGVETIYKDYQRNWKGKALGIFVAPGALGLFIGTLLAKNIFWNSGEKEYGLVIVLISISICFLLAIKLYSDIKLCKPLCKELHMSEQRNEKLLNLLFMFCCFCVVVLRSYVGMTVTFSWETTAFMGLISVIAIVFGKMTGGILAARFGNNNIIILSLGIAAIGYYFSTNVICGAMALFFFNMTMPVTLYLLVDYFRELPGFFFGLLTFGLFLGFLPTYFNWKFAMPGNILGTIVSIVSFLTLFISVRIKQKIQ